MESWIKENYEKVAIGGAAVIALAVGATILLGGDDASKSSGRSVTADNNTEVEGFSELSKTLERRTGSDEIINKSSTNVFVGQALYAKQGSDDPVDLENSPPVHEGIENSWWIKYDLDPGFGDSPDRDPDEDGFTNREEHDAETSPVDNKSHPELYRKLLAGEVEAFRYRLRWSEFAKPQITLRYLDVNGVQASQQAAPGDIVFKEGPMKDRFKLGERVQAAGANGREQDAFILLDQSPLKVGRKLTLLRRGPDSGSNEFSDLSVSLSLDALGQASKPFKVEEGGSFSLPYDADAKLKPYRLKKIEPAENGSYTLHFEYTDSEGKSTPFERQGKAAPTP